MCSVQKSCPTSQTRCRSRETLQPTPKITRQSQLHDMSHSKRLTTHHKNRTKIPPTKPQIMMSNSFPVARLHPEQKCYRIIFLRWQHQLTSPLSLMLSGPSSADWPQQRVGPLLCQNASLLAGYQGGMSPLFCPPRLPIFGLLFRPDGGQGRKQGRFCVGMVDFWDWLKKIEWS